MLVIDILVIVLIVVIAIYLRKTNLNPLKKMELKSTGQGQHGTARFSRRSEFDTTFKKVDFRPDLWRQGQNLPTTQGLIVHCEHPGEYDTDTFLNGTWTKVNKEENNSFIDNFIKNRWGREENTENNILSSNRDSNSPLYCFVDDNDVHTLLIGASGIGKTAFFLYPNIEYAFATGMSFITTDTKGDLYRNTGTIGEKYYGYEIKVIDLRNPMESSCYNMMYLVNKYMDLFKKTGEIKYQAKAEKYAKITSKTIIESGIDMTQMGSNTYFYDSAEGIVTAALLLLAEYGGKGERHVVSCFKLIQELLGPSNLEGRNKFQALISMLPKGNRAAWYASTALETAPETMQSVMSTAMSKLLSFLDAELEQILCFKNDIDVERFCDKKTAVYIVLPEEDTTKHFIASLFIQQMYREILLVADAKGGVLNNRVMFFCDELGTMPKIDGMEAMFSAARSRKISIVAIIQSLAQFEKTYGKEGAEIIADNCQNTLFGGFAPNSETAKKLSENLGKQTVESGSVSYNGEKNFFFEKAQSRTINMIERPLMTVDELKNMPKGHFILMKTGNAPFKTALKLFIKWGISFEEKYKIPRSDVKQTKYVDIDDLCVRIVLSNPEFDEPDEEG